VTDSFVVQDETGGNRLPSWRESAVVQLAEAIAVITANEMGYEAPPEFGVLFKSSHAGLTTLGMNTRGLIFINAPYFVGMFDSCSNYSEARVVLSELRETTLHEMTHHYKLTSSDMHDRQFWDFMCKMSNDWDVCDALRELFVALGCTGMRARRSSGAYMLDLITRVFNPKYKAKQTARSKAPAHDSDGEEDWEEEEEEEEEKAAYVPKPGIYDEIIDLTHSSDEEEPPTKREREPESDDEGREDKRLRASP
jgi:predicted Zn-dependent protease with MMP-like domain